MGLGDRRQIHVVLALIAMAILCLGATGTAYADDGIDEEEWITADEIDDGAYHATSEDGDGGVGIQAADDEDIEVAVTASPTGETYASDGTIHAFAGVFDTSGTFPLPIEGEDVTVEIEDPEGDIVEFEGTTDENGSVDVDYDLDPRPDGEFAITVIHAETGTDASIVVPAGTSLVGTTRGGDGIYIGEETTFSFLARDGEYPRQGIEVDYTVTKNGDEVTSGTAETDEDGFVDISFTPQEVGDYTISTDAEDVVSTYRASRTVTATEFTTESDVFRIDPVTQGQTAAYFGRLASIDGTVADRELVIEFTDRDTDETFTVETQTDEHGFFAVDYEVPDEADSLAVDIETADGEDVVPHRTYISVDAAPTPDDDDDEEVDEEFVDFSISIDESYTAPGDEVNANLAASHNGEPIASQNVEIVFRYGWSADGAPVFSETVVTDDDGVVEASIQIPSNAPDDTRISAHAVMSYEDQTYEDSTGVDIEELDVDVGGYDPGEVTVEVENISTGEAVENIPVMFDEQYTGQRSGSYETGSMLTDESGAADVSFETPDDLGFYASNNPLHRYSPPNHFQGIFPGYPGTVSATQETAAPGEEVDVEFDVPNGAVVDGIVYGDVSFPQTSFAIEISSEDGGTITVPENAADGERLSLNVWGMDEDGDLYQDRHWSGITVEVPDETTAAFDVDPDDPFTGQTVTFDASASTAAEGELGYEWAFGDGETVETDDAVVEHVYEETGEFEVELTVTDDADNSDTTAQTVTVSDEPDVDAVFEVTPDDPEVNKTVTFDASNSTAQTDIDKYVWAFGDGMAATTTDPVVEHEYNESGEYNVELTVHDADENTDNTTQTIEIADDEPFLDDPEDQPGLRAGIAVLAVVAAVLVARKQN